MRRLSVWIDLIGMGQALAGHGPASGPASGARKRSGRTLQRPRPWWSSRNACEHVCEQFSAEMLESGQFPSRARSRAHRGVGRSPLVHWRLLTRLLHSPVVVWSWFCDIKITITPLSPGFEPRGGTGKSSHSLPVSSFSPIFSMRTSRTTPPTDWLRGGGKQGARAGAKLADRRHAASEEGRRAAWGLQSHAFWTPAACG